MHDSEESIKAGIGVGSSSVVDFPSVMVTASSCNVRSRRSSSWKGKETLLGTNFDESYPPNTNDPRTSLKPRYHQKQSSNTQKIFSYGTGCLQYSSTKCLELDFDSQGSEHSLEWDWQNW